MLCHVAGLTALVCIKGEPGMRGLIYGEPLQYLNKITGEHINRMTRGLGWGKMKG